MVLNLKGIKRIYNELFRNFVFGLEDERRSYKYVLNVVLDLLFLKCRGSMGSLDSIGFNEFFGSFCDKNN